MILVHIITNDKLQALEIVHLLTLEKLISNAIVSKKMMYEYKDELIKKKQFLIIGQTKGLLFKLINEKLSTNYLQSMPILYAVPIIYMDENQTHYIRQHTAKV
ncbi:divalent cation tolerance protein CutA [Cellulophaga sp. Hel_I_12]|uniref:divalent cation tolerance protein CutA n=1 Tax=Cellulophaga sp. Hel_I_12 TaxID=1249972 RepID=UPI000645E1B3|nr:divalent cation tolerance protein CutA [Cellulophaga sp. Hel_I_12]